MKRFFQSYLFLFCAIIVFLFFRAGASFADTMSEFNTMESSWAATALVAPTAPQWNPVNDTSGSISQKIYVDLSTFSTDLSKGSDSSADGSSAHPYGSIRYAMTTGCPYTTGAVEIIVTGASIRTATRAWADNTHRAVDFVIHSSTASYVKIGGAGAGLSMLTYYDATTTTTG